MHVKIETTPQLYELFLQVSAMSQVRCPSKNSQGLTLYQNHSVLIEDGEVSQEFEDFEGAIAFLQERKDLLSCHIYQGKPIWIDVPIVVLPDDIEKLPEMVEDFFAWGTFLSPVQLHFTPQWFCTIKYNHTTVYEAECCADAIAYFVDELKEF